MGGKGKARAVQPLGHIARRVHPDEEEGHAFRPAAAQRRQPVGHLFEAGAEQAAQRLKVIGAFFCRAGEAGIGHDKRRRAIGRQRPLHQRRRRWAGKAVGAQDGGDFRPHRRIGQVQRHLPVARFRPQHVGNQQLFAVPVITADRPHHDVRRQEAQAGAALAQPVPGLGEAADLAGQRLGPFLQRREVVAVFGHEAPRLGHGIALHLAAADALGGKGRLFALVGGMEPQQGLADAGEAGGKVRHFQRRQLDPGEDRIAQHLAQAAGVLVAVLGGEVGDVDLVTARQTQQHVGRDRALVAFQQGDVAGGDAEVIGHGLLGQAQFAAQAAQARAKVEGAGNGHGQRFVRSAQLYKENL